MGHEVSFSLDGIITLLANISGFVLHVFKPVLGFVYSVSKASWAGMAVIFAIFFALFLIRMGARTGKGVVIYAAGLEYVGGIGLAISAGLLTLLAVEYACEPIIAIFSDALWNTMSGGEPGIFHLLGFLIFGGPSRNAFFADVASFYAKDHTILPMGPRVAGLVAVAFGTMFLVAKSASRFLPHIGD